MNDPKNPGEEPKRVSNPDEMPTESNPPSEFEKNVPHTNEKPISMTGGFGRWKELGLPTE